MSERAELVRAIWSVETMDFGGYSQRDAEAVADNLLAVGYRKPRSISTLEEITLLEPGAIIQGPDWHEETFKCTAPATFHAIASAVRYRPSELIGRGPFTVLREATA